ncbi:hypothetical protein RFI_12170 [Reticulomyxa filosa]|uniref:Uncharacterized protein n=1 Tax=Reticulomyxa filosa TaxID=46433 RepID=X6NF83_RETFI|nr:hypothetical protein RFI_12170 [Reticulomyxa filosa]|eukprot:ETO24975.1 hypothetical protein RFI_12170 [Reticulomyxa filosa]
MTILCETLSRKDVKAEKATQPRIKARAKVRVEVEVEVEVEVQTKVWDILFEIMANKIQLDQLIVKTIKYGKKEEGIRANMQMDMKKNSAHCHINKKITVPFYHQLNHDGIFCSISLINDVRIQFFFFFFLKYTCLRPCKAELVVLITDNKSEGKLRRVMNMDQTSVKQRQEPIGDSDVRTKRSMVASNEDENNRNDLSAIHRRSQALIKMIRDTCIKKTSILSNDENSSYCTNGLTHSKYEHNPNVHATRHARSNCTDYNIRLPNKGFDNIKAEIDRIQTLSLSKYDQIVITNPQEVWTFKFAAFFFFLTLFYFVFCVY